jgi:hypothetical protein
LVWIAAVAAPLISFICALRFSSRPRRGEAHVS